MSGDTADVQQFGLELINITNGIPDSSWTPTDYDAVFAQLSTLASSVASHMQARLTITEIRAYTRAFRPYSDAKPFVDSGAPAAVHPLNVPGSNLGALPPQVSSTITEITPSRRHWGRTYLPTLADTDIGTNGRVTTTAQTALLNAWYSCYTNLQSVDFFPVVPTTMVEKRPTRTLQVVNNLRIDDVVDVIRRRRHASAIARLTLPAIAATQPADAEE